jgi:hypothetical protein
MFVCCVDDVELPNRACIIRKDRDIVYESECDGVLKCVCVERANERLVDLDCKRQYCLFDVEECRSGERVELV